MKVELIEKYEMSIGTVLIIKSNSILSTGDTFAIDNNKYQIKKILQPTGHMTKQKFQYLLSTYSLGAFLVHEGAKSCRKME